MRLVPPAYFGSIDRQRSGRYRARYEHEGQRHAAPQTFRTKADARAWLDKQHTTIRENQWVDPKAGQVAFETFARTWLSNRALRETTTVKYDHLLDHHILPTFGHLGVGRIAPSDVAAWYKELRRRYRSTGDDAYRLLRAIMRTAVDHEIIAKSPCRVQGAGGVQSPKRRIATPTEVITAIRAVPERYRAALILSAWCHLRRGEVLGLQRRHIDLAAGTLRIEQAWVMVPTPHISDPKSYASARTIAMPPDVLPWVEAHLTTHTGPGDAWLFESENHGRATGHPMTPTSLDRIWRHARVTIDRPDLRLHDLRHSGLTWAAWTGASLAELMRRGGHSTARAALIYQSAVDERDKLIASGLRVPGGAPHTRPGPGDESERSDPA